MPSTNHTEQHDRLKEMTNLDPLTPLMPLRCQEAEIASDLEMAEEYAQAFRAAAALLGFRSAGGGESIGGPLAAGIAEVLRWGFRYGILDRALGIQTVQLETLASTDPVLATAEMARSAALILEWASRQGVEEVDGSIAEGISRALYLAADRITQRANTYAAERREIPKIQPQRPS